MLTQWLESLLMFAFNSVRDRRPRRQRHSELSEGTPDPAVVGHLLAGSERSGSPHPVVLPPATRRKHLYAIGATGCGKTNLLLRLIEADIAASQAFCVIDLRGDLVDRVLLRLAHATPADALAGRLLLLDLRDTRHVVGFNPLAGDGDVHSRTFHLLSVLRHQAESWGVQLEETLRNALLALSEAGWSLLELDPLLTDAAFRATLLREVSESQVQAFFRRYHHLSADRQQTFALPVLNKVTPLLGIPELRLLFGARQSAFSFRQLLDHTPGAILLIALSVDRLHEAASLVGGLLVSAFQNSVMARVDQPETERVPVHLYIDEFETMATERFEAIIAEGRRFGVGLCLSHQNTAQLPARLKQVIRNNVYGQFLFQTGALDAAELAGEIASDQPKESVRTALMQQGVGECYLVRRGEPAVPIRICHSPDPKIAAAAVEAVREAARRNFARPRSEVEQDLIAREQARLAPVSKSSRSSGSSGPAYEVRHARKNGPGKQKPTES